MAKVRKGPGKETEPKREMTIGEVARLGGLAAAQKLSKEARHERALHAINTRWRRKREAEAAA